MIGAHHRRADDWALMLSVDALWHSLLGNSGHCRGADRPVARPHHWPHAREPPRNERRPALRPQPDKNLGGLVAVDNVSFDVARGRWWVCSATTGRESRRSSNAFPASTRRKTGRSSSITPVRFASPMDARRAALRRSTGPGACQQSRRRRQHLPRPRGQDAPLGRAPSDA